jgi:hypothetical protein
VGGPIRLTIAVGTELTVAVLALSQSTVGPHCVEHWRGRFPIASSKANPNLAKLGQASAKTIKEKGLVFLGFLSPNRDFSRTCTDHWVKK